MYKITFNSATKLSTITNKPTKVDIVGKPKIEECVDANDKIKEYVNTHYPNAYKFVVTSDCLTIYNPVHEDLDIIEVSLDVVINE